MEVDWMKENPPLLEDFIEDCKMRDLSSETIRMYKSNVRRFLNEVSDPENAGEKELKEFLLYLKNEREVGYKTMVNYFSAVSSFYDYLIYEGRVEKNPVLPVRKRYLRSYKKENGSNNGNKKQVPEPKEMSGFINYIPKIRDKCIVLLTLKVGARRNEIIDMDVQDIDWEEYSIRLKDKPKRSNTIVYFDRETARVLKQWIDVRNERDLNTDALFVNEHGGRLKRHGVYHAVTKWAEKYGLHNPESDNPEEKLSVHTLRHVFTTYLIRNGMKREYIKELRGDTRSEAMDIYHQIDRDELRKEYQACMPELGIV